MAISAKWLAIASMLTILNVPATASAQDAPSWTVTKTKDRCVLTRKADQPEPSLLMLSGIPGGDIYSLVIGVGKLPRKAEDGAQVKIVLTGIDKTVAAFATSGQVGGATPDALQIDYLNSSAVADIARSSALRVDYNQRTLGPFPLPDVTDAIAALNDCLGEHLVTMGADPAQFKKGGARPELLKSQDGWFTLTQMRSVIQAGVRDGIEAIFRIEIDNDGVIAACSQIGNTQPAAVEQAVCKPLTAQKLFKPARDPAGHPVRGIVTYRLLLVKHYFTSNIHY